MAGTKSYASFFCRFPRAVVFVAASACAPGTITDGRSGVTDDHSNAGETTWSVAGHTGATAWPSAGAPSEPRTNTGATSNPAGGSSADTGRAHTAPATSGSGATGLIGTAGHGAPPAADSGASGATSSAGRTAVGGDGSGSSRATLYVQDGILYDRCGEKVVMRGINHPTLYVDRKGAALPEIAKTGANAVRLFWYASNGVAISEAEPAISGAIANGMLPILEMHDSTCAWNLDGIVSYWTSAEAVRLIERYQANMIVNIANETRPPNADEFQTKYSSVIGTLRKAGIHTPLMIDGGNCGRDYNMLLDKGQALLDADPDHNLIFSAHLYDPMSQAAMAQTFDTALQKQLAFVVGEFANRQPPGCGAALDYKDMIAEADKRGIGWLAWSWGDNDPSSAWNSDCAEFDMTGTFSFDSLERWGKEVAVTLPQSIKNTAVRPASLLRGSCQ